VFGSRILAAKRSGARAGSAAVLIGAGVALQALLIVFTLLYANVPPGFNAPYGLCLHSVGLFRRLWSYPAVSLSATAFSAAAALTLLALWAVYLAAALLVRRPAPDARPREVFFILGLTCLFNIELAVLMPPVLSADVFHYALFGRMVAFYKLNPYVVPGSAISHDPFWSLAIWRDITTQYGPAWTLLSAAAAAAGGQSVLLTVIIFKLVAALFNLAAAVLVFLLVRRLTASDGVRPLLLYAWNPLILIESAGSGHNDVVMIAIALAGVLLAARGRVLTGLVLLLASAMVKYLTLLLVLFYVIHYAARETAWKRRAAVAGRMGVVSVVVIAGLYLPFLVGVDSARQLAAGLSLNPMPNLVRPLVIAVISRLLVGSGGSVPFGITPDAWAGLLLHGGFAALLVLLARRVAVQRAGVSEVASAFGLVSLVYPYVVFGGSFPWYLVSPLAIALLGPQRRADLRLLVICIGLGIGLMLGYAKLIAA
jgi:hypothetical protein